MSAATGSTALRPKRAEPSKPSYVIVVPWAPDHGGGVNEVVLNLYRTILAAGELQPLILVSHWDSVRPVETERNGRRIVHWRLWAPWTDGSGRLGVLKWLLAAPMLFFDVARFSRIHRVAVYNFHYPQLGAWLIALLRSLGVVRAKLVLTFHGLDLASVAGAARIERAEWGFVFRWTTAVTACSTSFAEEVRKALGGRVARVQPIANGLDIDHLLGSVDRAGELPGEIRDREFVLSVATFEHKKGLDVLLRGFEIVRRRRPALALVLVGRTGGAAAELRALADELGMAADVFFEADVPHAMVGWYLERARAFCLPSRSEPFGIAVLEAGAYRLPVVASRVGGIPEIIVDGESGILVDPEDVNALAAALARVLDDPDLAGKLGERLFQRVAAEFTWKRAYEGYRSLLGTLGPSAP
jgi:glycosyltransferase involved in cell wall biosynthesis